MSLKYIGKRTQKQPLTISGSTLTVFKGRTKGSTILLIMFKTDIQLQIIGVQI